MVQPLERLPEGALRNFSGEPNNSQPGFVVVDRQENLVLVRCRENWAGFRDITVDRKAVMSAVDFSNGYMHKVSKEWHRFVPSHV